MPTSFDEANLGHGNDTSEPSIEQLHTDTDEEYIVHSNEEIEESEEMDEHNYSLRKRKIMVTKKARKNELGSIGDDEQHSEMQMLVGKGGGGI
ncbi:hypothetical protein MTR_7g055963 [Medicago truncatula]|uniref:Uncharacterized protein n=1 Tax=Medicago truncatula TaxID=3880 RepID=A0A072U0C1_MEDTR|nr:hypothetical protein MTR_7g055963 [Medicago truncatula]